MIASTDHSKILIELTSPHTSAAIQLVVVYLHAVHFGDDTLSTKVHKRLASAKHNLTF